MSLVSPGSARDAAQQFVAMTFIQPLLKEVRESNDAAAPFAPTQGEKMFGAMLDERIAQDNTRASDWDLIKRIESDLLRTGQAIPAPSPQCADMNLPSTLSIEEYA